MKGRCFYAHAQAGCSVFSPQERKSGAAFPDFLFDISPSAGLFSVLNGTEQAAKDLRSNIGAVFYVRPYQQMIFEGGAVSEGATPIISQKSIDEIVDAAEGQVKAYNTEHYGYAKSEQLHFLPGAGDNEASNMGQVTAVRDSQLTDVFLNEECTLISGRHIQPEDENKILISAELAAENDLKVGDILTLTHAGLDQQDDGTYIDTIPEKTAFAEVEIVGISNVTELPTAQIPLPLEKRSTIFIPTAICW